MKYSLPCTFLASLLWIYKYSGFIVFKLVLLRHKVDINMTVHSPKPLFLKNDNGSYLDINLGICRTFLPPNEQKHYTKYFLATKVIRTTILCGCHHGPSRIDNGRAYGPRDRLTNSREFIFHWPHVTIVYPILIVFLCTVLMIL